MYLTKTQVVWANEKQILVPGARIELATPAFSGRRSTTELPRQQRQLSHFRERAASSQMWVAAWFWGAQALSRLHKQLPPLKSLRGMLYLPYGTTASTCPEYALSVPFVLTAVTT
jgi:hypothetical protein